MNRLTDSVSLLQVIDAARSIEEVHTDIVKLSENAINCAENLPIRELWK